MSRTSEIEVADLWGWHIPTITDIEAGIVKDYHVGGWSTWTFGMLHCCEYVIWDIVVLIRTFWFEQNFVVDTAE